ncbi:MAG TPA: NYN domain-containing protein [Thermoanaerobaculia bacterium]|nr:NYN domain-containing protein [Thermoanaerobaculia bacterium]
MRPTAEGQEEENRNKPKQENQEREKAAAVPIPLPEPAFEPVLETSPEPAPLNEAPAEAALQPDWYLEPTSPPPAPVFAESDTSLPIPMALPPEPFPELTSEEARFDDEPFEDEDGGAEESEEIEASEGEREDKEGEDKEGESKAEGRRRRSRGRRGGKRRANGKAASPATAEPSDDEEDDDDPFEAAHEEPAPAPVPSPRRIAPVHAPAQSHAAPAAGPQYRVSSRGSDSYVISQNELEPMTREIIISIPDRQRSASDERKIALFCDFENIALGVRDSDTGKFEITLVLERLLEKGKIIVKKAYADWERYSDYKRPFHEAAIELIDIPQKFYSGKNSADIKMVVDAMDLSYSKEHLDTFVILSGDSDFSPLVSKLKENNKYVIGIGVKNSSSNLLVDNCDEFIYYEDVWRDAQKGPKLDGLNKKTAEAFSLMIESIQALIRENKDVLWGSMIKQTMQRKKPSFNEGYYGYSTFSELLEDAERKQIIKLKKDQRSGTYIVTGFAKTGETMAPSAGRR